MRALGPAILIAILAWTSASASPPPPPADPKSNAEMSSIFKADQTPRLAAHIEWAKVEPADAERREQTRKLLASGRLHTGEDYLHAAYVFQHGQQPSDYLLAHTLAMVAVSKGVQGGLWIAAATLDRYLMRSGQPQIYGTQYVGSSEKPGMSQDPYDRALISDALRRELSVPVQVEQAAKLAEYNAPPKP